LLYVQAADEEEEEVCEASSESEELAAVDFMDSDVEGPANLKDSRFDSSDDDEAGPAAPGNQQVLRAAISHPSDQETAGIAQTVEVQRQQPAEPAAVRAANRFDSSDEEEGDAAAAVLGSELPAAKAEPREGSDSLKGEGVAAEDDSGDGSGKDGGSESAGGGDNRSSSSSEEGSGGSEESQEEAMEDLVADEENGDSEMHEPIDGVAEQHSESEGDEGDAHRDGSSEEESDISSEYAQLSPAGPEEIIADGEDNMEHPASEGGTISDAEEAGSAHDLEAAVYDQRSKEGTGQQAHEDRLAGLKTAGKAIQMVP
jgi:hypothetical protein